MAKMVSSHQLLRGSVEHVKDIGAELNAEADGAERKRAFQHPRRLPVTGERECGRQPTEPATDNEDRALCALTSASPLRLFRWWAHREFTCSMGAAAERSANRGRNGSEL
jgi:hypothetical protein